MLLGVEFLDELDSGVPMVGAPSIQVDLAVSYLETSGALLVVPLLLSFLLEPALLLLADRADRPPLPDRPAGSRNGLRAGRPQRARKWLIAGGLLGMAIGALACALAPNALVLTLATGLSFVATGAGVSTAQATLIDAHPGRQERTMTRWAMLGVAGDLAAPLLMAGLAAFSLGWRAACALVGAATAIWAIAAACVPMPSPAAQDASPPAPGPSSACVPTPAPAEQDANPPAPGPSACVPMPAPAEQDADPPAPGLWVSLRAALGNGRLLVWLLGSWLCCLLDEIVVVFGSLYLRDRFDAGVAAQSAVMVAFLIGGAAGLAATDRLLDRVAPRRLLLAAAASCALLYLIWLAMPSLWLSALAMSAVGAAAAPLYPLAAAQAYAAFPGRSSMVQVAGHVFDPLDIAVPLLLGWLADRHGTWAALLVLVAQPAGLAVIAALMPSGPDVVAEERGDGVVRPRGSARDEEA